MLLCNSLYRLSCLGALLPSSFDHAPAVDITGPCEASIPVIELLGICYLLLNSSFYNVLGVDLKGRVLWNALCPCVCGRLSAKTYAANYRFQLWVTSDNQW